jgi:hypothetical protein
LIGLSALAIKVFESTINLALIFIGIFVVVHKICSKIIYSKKESFGVISKKYPRNSIAFAKVIRVLNYGLLLIVIFLGINSFLSLKNKCSEVNNQLGVLISSFDIAGNDDFSYKLYTTVSAEVEHADSINVFRVDKMVNIGRRNYLDSIKTVFEDNCSNHGLYVFGRRSVQSNLFDCSVYINNMKIVNLDSSENSSKNIIHLQNPDLINFSIENQAQIVSKFIVGLLQYHGGHFADTRATINRCIASVSNIDNIKFKSYCFLLLGNSFFKENLYSDAIEAFRAGLKDDSTNAFLHYNMATSILMMGDSLAAQNEYSIANKLNSKLSNPLSGLEFKSSMGGGAISGTGAIKTPVTEATKVRIDDTIRNPIASVDRELKIKDSALYRIFRNNGKFGLRHPKGDTIIKCEYDQIYLNGIIYKGLLYFIVRLGSKYGAYDEKGVLAVPINWPSVYYVEEYITATR